VWKGRVRYGPEPSAAPLPVLNGLPPTGSVRLGGYALEVGPETGSFAQFRPDRERKHARELAKALAEKPEEPLEAIAAPLEEVQHTAEAVTDRIEHARTLFRAAAEGRLLDPELLTAEIGSLLGLLQRLDRAGRFDEELRLAKALHGLLALGFRWLELVRSLRMVLAAARRAGDEAGQAWALNELGALHLCADDAKQAAEHLEEALGIEERIGDAAGRCAARHNLDCARREVARKAALRRRRVAAAAAALVLFAAGAALGFGLGDGTGGADDTSALPTTGPTPDTTETTTIEPTTETAPQEFTLEVVTDGDGVVRSADGTIDCAGCTTTFDAATRVTLTATADPGSAFMNWDDTPCEETDSTADSCTVTVERDLTATAVFKPLVTVSVKPAGNGTVTSDPPGIDCPETCSWDFAEGTPLTLTAQDTAEGWAFNRWEKICEGSTNPSCGPFDVTPGVIAVPVFSQPEG